MSTAFETAFCVINPRASDCNKPKRIENLSFQNKHENGSIPWLKSGEVAQGYIYQAEEFITEEGLNNSSAKLFPINSVLVAMYGATAGQVGILKFEATTNQAVCAIYPNEKAIPEYLYCILKQQTQAFVALSGGGGQPNISQQIIKDFEIPLPPLEIQQQIVAEM
jgi:restriction endonuclease S subunit